MGIHPKKKSEHITLHLDHLHLGQHSQSLLRSRLLKFLLIRIKTICFRIFNIVGVIFDIYAVNMKFKRGHNLWVILSIVCLLFPAFVGSMYSLYFFIRDKDRNNTLYSTLSRHGDSKPRKLSSISEVPNRQTSVDSEDLVFSDAMADKSVSDDVSGNIVVQGEASLVNGHTTGVCNMIEQTDGVNDGTSVLNILNKDRVPTRSSALRRAFRMKSSSDKLTLKSRGTHAELQIQGDLTHNTCTRQFSQDSSSTKSTLYQEFIGLTGDFRDFLPSHRRTVFFHCLLLSREFRFYSTSLLLWDYILSIPENPEDQAPIKALASKHVKEICVIQKWYDFVKAEATARQINLLMSTLENVLMTMIQLLYWSSQNEATVSPDPLELITIFSALIQIAYNVVSTYNHQRQLNCLKENISLLHKVWLTITHMFLIASRMLSFYTFLCLGTDSLVFLLTILSLQVLNYLNSVRELYPNNTTKSVSTASVIVSSMLLIFIYAPASTKSKRTITKSSYNKNMLLESIWIVVFSVVQLTSHSEEFLSGMTWMRMQISLKWVIIGYLSAFLCYVLGTFMSVCSRHIFKYAYVTESDIIKAIDDVNKEFGTEFRFLKNDVREDNTPRIFGTFTL